MTDYFLIKTLDYGVLGLCAVMVVFTARILYIEQKREGEPRVGLLRFVYSFLGFCVTLAILNVYLQVNQPIVADPEEITQLRSELSNYRESVVVLRSKLDDLDRALDDKSYTELSSLVAMTDPVDRERLEREINRLKERVSEARAMVQELVEN